MPDICMFFVYRITIDIVANSSNIEKCTKNVHLTLKYHYLKQVCVKISIYEVCIFKCIQYALKQLFAPSKTELTVLKVYLKSKIIK